MSDTPRTDKAAFPPPEALVTADFARKLEREVARLTAEVAALKACDPLAEMWRELSEYQPQADRDGHGESWARMCRERTERAAYAAAWARGASPTPSEWSWASRAAQVAAEAAVEAAIFAQRAIDAIRRAKEVKR
jgi:hypothetical protein